jgi:hypothetical protein
MYVISFTTIFINIEFMLHLTKKLGGEKRKNVFLIRLNALAFFSVLIKLFGVTAETTLLCLKEPFSRKVKKNMWRYNMKRSIGKTLFCLVVATVFLLPLMSNTACASEITFYFNDYDEGWETNPGNMIDGNENTYASTTDSTDIEWLNGNTCTGTELGTISLVEIRVKGNWSGAERDIILQPIFGGTLPGDYHIFDASSYASWSRWFDITDDNNSYDWWTWRYVDNLECKVIVGGGSSGFTLYCSKVEIRVTYTL